MSYEDYMNHVDFLRQNHFLIKEDANLYSEKRYARSFLHYQSNGANPAEVQKKLANKKVMILGCGGIGNHVALILATSGIGEIVLVDDDIIELTNLTRQILFTESDVGKTKSAVIKRELLARNSNIIVSEINLRITKQSLLARLPAADIWIVSADEPAQLMTWVNRYCVATGQSYINAGYVNDIAIFGPLYVPGKTGCYECQNVIANTEINEKNGLLCESVKSINNNYKVATFPPVNAVAAAFCAGDIIKFLGEYDTPLALNKRIGIWSNALKIEHQNMNVSPLCQICGGIL